MKIKIILILIAVSINVSGNNEKLLDKAKKKITVSSYENEVVFGGMTYHLINTNNAAQRYEHQRSSNGRLIQNPLIGIRKRVLEGNDYFSHTGFIAEDSVGSPVAGYIFSSGYQMGKILHGGVVLGGYFMSNEVWEKREINSFSVKFGDHGIVPVVGAELNFQFFLNKKYYLKVNNLITLILTNHTISIGRRF